MSVVWVVGLVCGLRFVVYGLRFVSCGLWYLRVHFKVFGFEFALGVATGGAARLCRRLTR